MILVIIYMLHFILLIRRTMINLSKISLNIIARSPRDEIWRKDQPKNPHNSKE